MTDEVPGVRPFLVPGLDFERSQDDEDRREQEHVTLISSKLASGIAAAMAEAVRLLRDHPPVLWEDDALERFEVLVEQLEEYSAGLGLLAALADAERPHRYRRVWVGPCPEE